MRAFISVLIAGLFLPCPVAAQGQTGTIHDSQWGVAFTIPDGWVVQQGSERYLFSSHTERGIVMVMAHPYSSLEALRTEAQKGLRDGLGMHLDVDGTVQPFGASFRGQLEGQPAQAYAVSVLSPTGGGITVLTATEPASYSAAYARRVEQIARSIQFAPSNAAPSGAPWAARLNGSCLTALSSYYSGGPTGAYVGSSEETVIDLCSAGHSSHSLAVDGGMGGGYNATRFFWTTHRSPAEYRPRCP